MSDREDGLSAWREPSRRSTACAAGVLESGRESPSIVTILTDEQLLALEGLSAVQPTVLPYADQHLADSHDREVAARTALRGYRAAVRGDAPHRTQGLPCGGAWRCLAPPPWGASVGVVR